MRPRPRRNTACHERMAPAQSSPPRENARASATRAPRTTHRGAEIERGAPCEGLSRHALAHDTQRGCRSGRLARNSQPRRVRTTMPPSGEPDRRARRRPSRRTRRAPCRARGRGTRLTSSAEPFVDTSAAPMPQRARRDQPRQRGRRAAAERREREHDEAGRVHATASRRSARRSAVSSRPVDRHGVMRGDDPPIVGGVARRTAAAAWAADVHDARVERRHDHAERDEREERQRGRRLARRRRREVRLRTCSTRRTSFMIRAVVGVLPYSSSPEAEHLRGGLERHERREREQAERRGDPSHRDPGARHASRAASRSIMLVAAVGGNSDMPIAMPELGELSSFTMGRRNGKKFIIVNTVHPPMVSVSCSHRALIGEARVDRMRSRPSRPLLTSVGGVPLARRRTKAVGGEHRYACG